MEVATLNKWMFDTYSIFEAVPIHICKEVIQRKGFAMPEEDLYRLEGHLCIHPRVGTSLSLTLV